MSYVEKPTGKGIRLAKRKFKCICENCGNEFIAAKSTANGCGHLCHSAIRFANNTPYAERQRESNRKYKKENRARCSERQRLREAGRLASAEEILDRDIIYSFFMGTCGICGEQMDYNDFHVDHIIPLSKDGLHIYDNVQATHPLCNNKKYNKVDYAIL